MKVTLKFTGLLAKIKKSVTVEATTAREALTALKLRPEFSPRKNPNRYLCKIKECKTTLDLDAKLKKDTLNIICEGLATAPKAMSGSGNNPYIRIIIGLVLIYVAVASGHLELAKEGAAMTMSGLAANVAFSMGVSLVLGGLSQLMMTKNETKEGERSYIGSATGNTVRSGTPIPIILGKALWGGHLFTLNIETQIGKTNTLAEEAARIIDEPLLNKWDSWRTLFVGASTGASGYNNNDAGGSGGGGYGTGGGDGKLARKFLV